MQNEELAFASIRDLIGLLDSKQVSSVEVTYAQLDRIDALDNLLNAYITVLHEEALAEAAQADQRRREGDRSPLLGIPIALKDLFNTRGVRTTSGARITADFIPDADAAVVTRLKAAGAVSLGKTNMMEFAYGYPHPDYGETANPWALDRTAGGSSGGSASAVSAGLAYGALGSDTGGSIRSPAAFCGLVGLKPTYGRVSRHGVTPLSWSLDHAGPLTRTVADTALIYDAIAGYDPLDPASASQPFESTADHLEDGPATFRLGIVEEFFQQHVEPEIQALARAAVAQLESLGCTVESVQSATLDLVGTVIMPILQSEATSYHWPTLLKRAEDYCNETRANLQYGALILAKDYLDAQRIRRQMSEAVSALLETYDALVFPTQPIVAPLLNSYNVTDAPEESLMGKEIGHTGYANLTGHPAVSVPCGYTAEGLPVGIQFTGRAFDERSILQIAQRYESATEWQLRQPNL